MIRVSGMMMLWLLVASATTHSTAAFVRAGRAPTPVACGISEFGSDTTKYVALTGARRRAGEVRLWNGPDGRLSYYHVWRRDSVTIVWEGSIIVGDDGFPREYAATLSANGIIRTSEVVQRAGDSVVTVRNRQRTAEDLARDMFFTPRATPTAVIAVIAQCAVAAGGELRTGRLGRVRVREVARLRLRNSTDTKTVALYALSSDSVPNLPRLWLDERLRFFAAAYAEIAGDILIQADWANSMDQLLLAEVRGAEARIRETAQELGERPARGVAIVHARIVDVDGGRARENMSVLVQGSRISVVAPDSQFKGPAGTMVVDATGKTLVPGLIDVGQHRTNGAFYAMTDRPTRDLISRGVTTIQEMEGDTVYTPRIVSRIGRGEQIGPRIVPGCLIDGWYPDAVNGDVPDRHQNAGQVRSTEEARRYIRRCRAVGMQVVLLNDNLSPALTTVAIREARRLGMRITGNALFARTTRDLVDAGYDEFAHVFQALVPFVVTSRDTAAWLLHRAGGIASFWISGATLANLDFHQQSIQDVVDLLAQRRMPLQTTLCVYPPINNPRTHDRTWDTLSFAKLQEFTRMLHLRGARVLPGTDSACPLTRELTLLQQAGFTNAELLRMATIDAARYLGLQHDVGSIAEGKRADLILSDGDPLRTIEDLERLSLVVRGGIVYRDLAALRADLPYQTRR